MSINAIEVLEARLKNRGFPLPTPKPEHIYHSPEWWDVYWTTHEEWQLNTYPPAAVTGFETTPATGVEPA